MIKPKLLFICTANLNRSRTAEDLLNNSDKYEVQSAGFRMIQGSGQLVTQELVNWADRIFLMNEMLDAHLTLLRSNFYINGKDVVVLDVEDRYNRGNEVLIRILRRKLSSYGIVLD